MKALLIVFALVFSVFSTTVSSTPRNYAQTAEKRTVSTQTLDEGSNKDVEMTDSVGMGRVPLYHNSFPSLFDRNNGSDHPLFPSSFDQSRPNWWPWKEIEALEKKIWSSIPKIPTDVGDDFGRDFLAAVDPKDLKNETKHDKKIVDGHVIETDEESYSTGGDDANRVVFKSKVVRIYPKDSGKIPKDGVDGADRSPVATPEDVETIRKLPIPTTNPFNGVGPDKDVEIVSGFPRTELGRNDLFASRNNAKKV